MTGLIVLTRMNLGVLKLAAVPSQIPHSNRNKRPLTEAEKNHVRVDLWGCDNTSSEKESSTSGINSTTTQCVLRLWTVSRIIWTTCIKMGLFPDCASLHDPRGRASPMGRPYPVSYPVSTFVVILWEDRHLADKPTRWQSSRWQDNSLTNQLADKPTRWQSTRWQDNSLTNQLADIRCIGLRKHWNV